MLLHEVHDADACLDFRELMRFRHNTTHRTPLVVDFISQYNLNLLSDAFNKNAIINCHYTSLKEIFTSPLNKITPLKIYAFSLYSFQSDP